MSSTNTVIGAQRFLGGGQGGSDLGLAATGLAQHGSRIGAEQRRRISASPTASTLTAWRRVRITAVGCKFGVKKPTSARCGSVSRSPAGARAERECRAARRWRATRPWCGTAARPPGWRRARRRACCARWRPNQASFGHIGAADLGQHLGPVALRVRQHADPAVLGLVGLAAGREHAHVADLASSSKVAAPRCSHRLKAAISSNIGTST